MTKRLLIASRVHRIDDVATGIRRFTVVPERRPLFPKATPGSHVTVRHRSGTLRSYSLCGDAENRNQLEFAVQREDTGRGGSILFHEDLTVGDPIHVSYPIPSLVLAEEARSHVFVAGGIGITPFIPLALEASRRGQPSTLHYAVRSRSQLAFLDQFAAIESLTLRVYVSEEGTRLDAAALIADLDATQHVYACGPERLLSALAEVGESAGVARVHLESFTGLDPDAARAGDPFTVALNLSQRQIDVRADQSLLQALNEAGLDVDYSCEGGVCGACRVTLVSGEAIHRDICLTDSARTDTIITCVSRGRGVLTLQL